MGLGLNSLMANAAGPNLIANPSVEASANNVPTGWTSSKYGTNTPAFSYQNTGCQDGNYCLGVNMSGWVSGDAKWYFAPVNVSPGTSYTFSNWYQSTVPTEINAVYTSTTGATTYKWLGTAAASATWKQGVYNFVTPAGTAKVTIFHVINKNGSLKYDNFTLGTTDGSATPAPTATATPVPTATPTPTTTPAPTPSTSPSPVVGNIVPNPGLETANGALPASWASGKWGTNTPTFEYANTGHTGSRSAKVTMANRTSGDAKWYFAPQTVTGGATYEASDWYQSNVATDFTAAITLSDGTTQYKWLGTASPSATWAQFKKQFTLPANAAKVTIFHVIATNGTLSTDDFALALVGGAGGGGGTTSRGLVSVHFDDGWTNQYTNALPVLSKYAIPATFYIICGTFTENPQYMTAAQVQAVGNAGHSIAGHTNTHPRSTQISQTQLQQELAGCQTTLRNLTGQPVLDHAWPYGDHNASTVSLAAQYYDTQRTVQPGYNYKATLNKNGLKVQNVLNTTTLAQVQGWLAQAAQDKSWLILVYHEVANAPTYGSDATYTVTQAQLDAQMNAVKNSGLGIVTTRQAIAEWQN